MKDYILNRLKEPSTWRGIILILTVFGAKLEPEQQEAIVLAGLGIVGLLGAFTKDEPKQVKIQLPPIDLQSYSEDDGRSSRDALRRGLRLNVPPDHYTRPDLDERQSGFTDK